MADISLYTANKVEVAEVGWSDQMTLPSGGAVTAGSAVRINTSGKFVHGNATDTTNNPIYGIATRSVTSGESVTAIRRGVLDGYDVESLAYWAPIYLSDTAGRLADAAGTTTVIVGRVIPVWGGPLGTVHKAILINVP